MSSEDSQIRKGDTVMLVWACCRLGRKFIGWVGEVENVEEIHSSTCKGCDYVTHGRHAWIKITKIGVVPISWLRKIPPEDNSRLIELLAELPRSR